MKKLDINKIRSSDISDDVKLFIRFCKIHDLYGFITKHYRSIFNLSADLNGRRVSTYVSALLNRNNICSTSYYDWVSKKREREEKTNKLTVLWHEFAKEQIKKDNEISIERLINEYARDSLSNSYYGNYYGSNVSNILWQSYSSVYLNSINEQIQRMSNSLINDYLNNPNSNLV